METLRTRFTAEDRRHQILNVATELFARQGFDGTTTRQIADAAGINEAIIFRHFATKQELYWQVIEHKCAIANTAYPILLEGGGSARERFRRLAERFLTERAQDPTLGRLLLFTALEHHQLSERFFRTHMAVYYEHMAGVIRTEIAAGRFRPVDPLLSARAFLGMLVCHVMIQELFGAKRYQDVDPRAAAQTITDLWLHGIAQPENPTE